jgi:hypothetical protein
MLKGIAMNSPSKKLPRGFWVVFAVLALIAVGMIGNRSTRESEIYVALYQAGYWASNEANKVYPFSGLTGVEQAKVYLAKREALYLERKAAGRESVAKSYGISQAEADRIQGLGDTGKWKVYDAPALFDPAGVTPTRR